jgi:hypothetical protein
MTARTFDFPLGQRRCMAMGHPNKYPTVTLSLNAGDELGETVGFTVRLSPAEAHAMAVALEAAATFAENTLQSGLGESVAS